MSKNKIVVSNNVPGSYLFSIDRITRTGCKLCNSELRDKVEETYDAQKKKNWSAIRAMLKKDHDFDIAVTSIRNHILYHYKRTKENESLQEYSEDIQVWMNRQGNKANALRTRIAMLERELFTIAQMGEDLDIIEKRKNAEIIKKLSETILNHEDKLREISEEEEPVVLLIKQLQVIITDEVQNSESSNTKKALSSVLDRLKNSIGDIQ
jgi:hypothetical protein